MCIALHRIHRRLNTSYIRNFSDNQRTYILNDLLQGGLGFFGLGGDVHLGQNQTELCSTTGDKMLI